MKLVKTIHTHEYGGTRTLGLGTIRFNNSGICVINDDKLAEKVVNSSKSLVYADAKDEDVKKLLAEMKKAEKDKNKPVDEQKLGEFIRSADEGVVAESSNHQKHGDKSLEIIGEPAGGEDDKGSFESSEEDNQIGSPATDDEQSDDSGSEEGDQQSNDNGSEESKDDAPAEDSKEESKSEEGSKKSGKKGSKGKSDENSDELLAKQLEAFEPKEIVEMISASDVEIPEGTDLEDKATLIKIAVENKII